MLITWQDATEGDSWVQHILVVKYIQGLLSRILGLICKSTREDNNHL